MEYTPDYHTASRLEDRRRGDSDRPKLQSALEDVAASAAALVAWLRDPSTGDPNAYPLLIAQLDRLESLRADAPESQPEQWGRWTIETVRAAEAEAEEKRKQISRMDAPARRQGWVYVLRNPEGLHKIGRTLYLERRLFALTSAAPSSYRLVHLIWAEDTLQAELVLHRRFALKRATRECFELSADDLAWLKSFDVWTDYPG